MRAPPKARRYREGRPVHRAATPINPFSGEKVPIWIGNFVLMGYGTGAIMAVPAHDQRDFEFCKQYGIPIRPVIRPVDGALADAATMKEAFGEDGDRRKLRTVYRACRATKLAA